MKKLALIILVFLIIFVSLISCNIEKTEPEGTLIIDAFGNEVKLTKESRIASCYASFAECYMLAGGKLVGVTSDAIEEHNLSFDDETQIIGTVKQISLEALIECNPDYVIMSADLSAHKKLEDDLLALGISYGYFRVDTFKDYKALMAQFTAITEREDLYIKNVLDTEERINVILSKIPKESEKRVLLMRIYSSGIKAKTTDNLAGQIIDEFGLINVADESPSILEDMSLEHVVFVDPNYIIALTMGDEKTALEYLDNNIASSLAWAELSAIKAGNYHVLPKDLFHYKPNNRWDQSYEYLAKIFYPEAFE